MAGLVEATRGAGAFGRSSAGPSPEPPSRNSTQSITAANSSPIIRCSGDTPFRFAGFSSSARSSSPIVGGAPLIG